MYEEKKLGMTFSVDARMELIFAIVSKVKQEYRELVESKVPHYYDNDYIKSFAKGYNDYADKMYDFIDLDKYPLLKLWSLIILNYREGLIPVLALMLDENFDLKENATYPKEYEDFFLEEDNKYFFKDLKEFVQNENYLEFYKSNYNEYHKMIEESNSEYPEDLDVKDVEKYYDKSSEYSVVYTIFINNAFGFEEENTLMCIKGLTIDENDKYFEQLDELPYLYHEFSHPIINGLVDKYWDNFEDTDEFVKYAVDNNLNPIYQGLPQATYYEYFVRAMSIIMSHKYEDMTEEIARDQRHGFPGMEEMISFINHNYNINDNFEEFFVTKLIPFTNDLAQQIKQQYQSKNR